MSISESNLGDLYMDENGKLWRVIGLLSEPSITMEKVEPEAQPNPAYGNPGGQGGMGGTIGTYQPQPFLPLPYRQKKGGGVYGAMWNGFKRIYKSGPK